MDYASAAALAQRLIEKNGRLTSFERLESAVADVDKPWKGAGSPSVAETVEQRAVFLPHSGVDDLGKYLADDELLRRCEQVLMTFVGTADLTTFQRVLDSGTAWKINWTRELKPGPTSLLYVMGVSR